VPLLWQIPEAEVSRFTVIFIQSYLRDLGLDLPALEGANDGWDDTEGAKLGFEDGSLDTEGDKLGLDDGW